MEYVAQERYRTDAFGEEMKKNGGGNDSAAVKLHACLLGPQ